jgi:hypothetical protein
LAVALRRHGLLIGRLELEMALENEAVAFCSAVLATAL